MCDDGALNSRVLLAVRFWLALSCAAFLGGCATPQAPVSPGVAKRLHRIGIVSITAQTFVRRYSDAVLKRPSDGEEVGISSWQLDEQYEIQIAAELRKSTNITPILLSRERSDFMRVNQDHARGFGTIAKIRRGAGNWIAIKEPVEKYCATNSLDGVVIVAERMTNRYPDAAYQPFLGAGTYAGVPDSGVSVIHLIAQVALMDCANSSPLAIRWVATDRNEWVSPPVQFLPILPISAAAAGTSMLDWSAEQIEAVRGKLLNIAIPSWGPTLKSIFLEESR
jgi:hypothetical protein